jgi:hypothetical protein
MTICRHAAGLTMLLVLAGCASGSHPAAAPSTSAPARTGVSAQLTVAQARSAFAAFLPKFNEIGRNPALIPEVTAGVETAPQTYGKGKIGFLPGPLSGEVFLVPSLFSYPRWFLAAGTGGSGRGFAFVMVQQSAGAPWREAAELYDLSPPFELLHDLGLAGLSTSTVLPAAQPNDTSMLVPPGGLPAAYAQYVSQHGLGAHRRTFVPGTYTTGYVAVDRQAAAGAMHSGWRYLDKQQPTGAPVYALQLPSGGAALVIFFTKATVSWTAMSAMATTSPGPTGLGAPPAAVLRQLGVSSIRPGLRIALTSIDENLAFVGPAGSIGVSMVVNDGKAVKATRS